MKILKTLIVSATILFAVDLLATDRKWVGGAEGAPNDWNVAANWENGIKPTRTDVAVFTSGDWCIVNSTTAYDVSIAGIRVNGGNVYFAKSCKPFGVEKSYCPTGMLFVVAGSTLCFSNQVGAGSTTDSSRSAIRKEGAGTVKFINRVGYSYNSGSWAWRPFIAAEGKVYLSPTGNSGNEMGFYGDMVIKDGAEVITTCYNALDNDAGKFTVEEGGYLTLSGGGEAKVGALLGAGTVRPGTSSGQTLTVRLSADSEFSGSITGIDVSLPQSTTKAFCVAGAQTLAGVSSFKIGGSALKFKPGIGDYWVKTISGYAGAVLNTEDTDGDPVRIHLGAAPTSVSFTGSGDVAFTASVTAKGSNFANTGALGTESGTLTFGDGSTAANDFDFSPFTSIFSLSGAGLVFKNVNPTTIAQPVIASGALTVSKDTAFADLNMNGGDMTLTGNTTINGGDSTVGTISLTTKTLTIGPNARVHGAKTTSMNNNFSMLKRPREQGVTGSFKDASANLVIDGGEFLAAKVGETPTFGPIEIRNGGTLTAINNFYAKSTKTLFIDGGTIRYSYASAAGGSFGSDSYPWRTTVGANGAKFDTDFFASYSSGFSVNWYVPTDTAAGITTDGGVTFDLPSVVQLHRAQNVSGPVRIKSGNVQLMSGAWKNGAGSTVSTPLGKGDLDVGNAQIVMCANDASRGASLASGTGAALNLSGAAVLCVRGSSSYAGQPVTVGPSGATACPITRSPGGVLFLRELGTDVEFDGSRGAFKSNGPVDVAADGRVRLPIFTLQNSPDYFESVLRQDFAKYDSDKGFVRFTDYTEGLAGGADSTALVDHRPANETTTVSEDTQVGALNVISYNGDSNKSSISINAGKKLTVGSGEAGSVGSVLLNTSGNYGEAIIGGSGTLEFGAAEGVIAVGIGKSYAHGPRVNCKIGGSGGVTYVSQVTKDYPFITVGGSSDYTGGTYINAVQVRPASADAFGRGTVRIGDGMTAGGQVYFGTALTITNDFSIAGNGVHWNKNSDAGALWFGRDVTLTGDVEVRGCARIGSRSDRDTLGATVGTGTFTGVISGGKLQVYCCEKPMVFEGVNTYAGGTEIISSTLVLKGAGTAGTGTVTLDNGVLRFENTAPVTFSNELDGVGRIEIAGTAPVTFAGAGFDALPIKTLAPGSSVDYPNCEAPTYVVGGDNFDINLNGRNITVAGISGSGTVRGGVMTVTGEINPGGANAIGQITFDRNPILSGVTIVVETSEGSVDKVVVCDDMDLSTFGVRIVQLGSRVDVKEQPFFISGGKLSGQFSAVEKPAKKGELYVVNYDETAVSLNYSKPGILMIVR